MSLTNELESLIYWSKRASSVKFKRPENKAVEHDLNHFKKRRLLRDARPDEYNLKALCASDQTIARRFEQELNAENAVTTDAMAIERRLYLLKEMSDMSGDTLLCRQVDQQMENYARAQSNLQELTEQYHKVKKTNKLNDHLEEYTQSDTFRIASTEYGICAYGTTCRTKERDRSRD
ncbi:hypothetical protein BD560DRAFT_89426 [Blakeslea trispora]|nr:hypothetical protein BD560DRAFT_89426 [Blakeslea trispora]